MNTTTDAPACQDTLTPTSQIISGILLALFGIVGIPSNIVNFYVFVSCSHRRKLRIRSSTIRILSNLTAADLIGSCINIPLCFFLFTVQFNVKTTITLSRVHFLITSPFLMINCICLILLSIDRHDAILRSNRYRLTDGRLKLALVMTWLFSFAIGVWAFFKQSHITLWKPETFRHPSPNSLLLIFGVLAVVCTTYSNFKIRNALKPKKNEVVHPASQLTFTRQAAECRILRAMILITLTLVLTYVPWGGVMIGYRFKKIRLHDDIYVICRTMLLVSHVTQPFIYFGASREFRHVIKSLLVSRSDLSTTVVPENSTLRSKYRANEHLPQVI